MMKYSFSDKAEEDLETLYKYGIARYGIDAADRYYDSLIERFESIAKHPHMYRVTNVREGYRLSVCGTHSIYYTIRKDEVYIVRILQRQNFE